LLVELSVIKADSYQTKNIFCIYQLLFRCIKIAGMVPLFISVAGSETRRFFGLQERMDKI